MNSRLLVDNISIFYLRNRTRKRCTRKQTPALSFKSCVKSTVHTQRLSFLPFFFLLPANTIVTCKCMRVCLRVRTRMRAHARINLSTTYVGMHFMSECQHRIYTGFECRTRWQACLVPANSLRRSIRCCQILFKSIQVNIHMLLCAFVREFLRSDMQEHRHTGTFKLTYAQSYQRGTFIHLVCIRVLVLASEIYTGFES